MTRDQIISKLFTSSNFTDCIRKMDPAHLQEDLKMEVMAAICELPEEVLLDLHRRGKIEHYTVRMMINMVINKYSAFYKNYRRQTVPFDAITGTHTDRAQEIDFDIIYSRAMKKHAIRSVDVVDDGEIEVRMEREGQEDAALAAVDGLDWYTEGILKLYLEYGNYRAIEKATGIPFPSCYKTVQKAFKQLKHTALCSISA